MYKCVYCMNYIDTNKYYMQIKNASSAHLITYWGIVRVEGLGFRMPLQRI